MKKSLFSRNRCSRSGFTLVELLVVIGIIAILATAVIGGASSAINAAKRLKAQNTAVQIQTAVVNYYTEYSVYPAVATTTSDAYYGSADLADWKALTYVLCGNINPYDSSQQTSGLGLNSRNIAFLSLSKSDLDTNGVPKNPFTTATAPEYFFIAMDTDYSNIIDTSATLPPDFVTIGSQSLDPRTITAKVAQGVCVWSNTSDSPLATTTTFHPKFWSHTY